MKVRHLIQLFFLSFFSIGQAKTDCLSDLKRIQKGTYEEVLPIGNIDFTKKKKTSKQEPPLPFSVQCNKESQLEKLLARRKVAYENESFIKGYTIQLYMGSSRTTALKLQDMASALQSTYMPELNYRQPNYTVWLGFFSDKLEAYFFSLSLAKKFPKAMLRPFMLTRQAHLNYKKGFRGD
ncbi:hypothetical protein [Cardinium endosymbiont of Tipula unca]|uniref:hypothetical protein n=1 Tax=Cardinium endosymbiont of Tipula unca TaxID=3066216 RepID=UPI0030D32EB9